MVSRRFSRREDTIETLLLISGLGRYFTQEIVDDYNEDVKRGNLSCKARGYHLVVPSDEPRATLMCYECLDFSRSDDPHFIYSEEVPLED